MQTITINQAVTDFKSIILRAVYEHDGYQRKAGHLVISRSCSRVDYAHKSMHYAALAH